MAKDNMQDKISNDNLENKTLTVNTPKGKIIVTVKLDDELYPGIYIDFDSEDIKEKAKIYSETLPLAMIEYNTVDKELCTFIWGESGNEDITHKICYNDSLIFDEDFEVLEDGTKVTFDGKIGFIMDNDRDNCPDGYKDSLNYYIKYSNPEESYDDVLRRIKDNNEKWYDIMMLWHDITVID